MADSSSPQDALYQHYGDVELRLVDEPTDSGKGMSAAEARTFLQRLKPVTRVKQTLAQAAKKVKPKG
jgi:hypothetical protein